MAFETVEISEIALRLIGAFYTFAGFVATRAALTSHFIDRAIAAITAEKPTAAETARNVWLLCAASLMQAGGVMLIAGLDLAAWLFVASSIGQTVYLFFVAPRYFDVEDPPNAKGRQQSINAFVVYTASTALVLWAFSTGRLTTWQETSWLVIALAGATVAGHFGYVIWMLARAPTSRNAALPE